MIAWCFSCFPSSTAAKSILGRLRRPQKCGINDLPDDILLDILSRLSPEHVGRCRIVCRRWKALTSTSYFIGLHLKRAVPSIIVSNVKGRRAFYMLKRWPCEATKTNDKMPRIPIDNNMKTRKLMRLKLEHPLILCFSSDIGVIVFLEKLPFHLRCRGLQQFTIINPTTQEKVKMITPGGKIYGVFLHPFLNQQPCILWGRRLQNKVMQFKLLNLGLKNSCWRDLRSSRQISHEPRQVDCGASSTIVDNVVYWMLASGSVTCEESIMAFNIKNEEFSIIPHPSRDKHDDEWCKKNDPTHSNMNLLSADGFVHLIEYLPSFAYFKINIWILKDFVKRFWVKTHSAVKINVGLPRSAWGLREVELGVIRIAAVYGEIIFQRMNENGIYGYNLKQGTTMEIKNEDVKSTDVHFSLYCAHTCSLVSLGNC